MSLAFSLLKARPDPQLILEGPSWNPRPCSSNRDKPQPPHTTHWRTTASSMPAEDLLGGTPPSLLTPAPVGMERRGQVGLPVLLPLLVANSHCMFLIIARSDGLDAQATANLSSSTCCSLISACVWSVTLYIEL